MEGTEHLPRAILLMGVSGCGKSTTGEGLAAELGWPFRDADSFHPAANIEKMSRGGYRHLPVLEGSTVVGMVSVKDLYAAVLDQLEEDIRELDSFIHGPGYGQTQ